MSTTWGRKISSNASLSQQVEVLGEPGVNPAVLPLAVETPAEPVHREGADRLRADGLDAVGPRAGVESLRHAPCAAVRVEVEEQILVAVGEPVRQRHSHG
jgi:hypothetical protein